MQVESINNQKTHPLLSNSQPKKKKDIDRVAMKALQKADEAYDEGRFKKSAKRYAEFLNSPAAKCMQMTSVYHKLFLSYMSLWENEKSSLEKLKKACAELPSYFARESKEKDKIAIHADLSLKVFEYAVSILKDNPSESFKFWEVLSQLYFKHYDLIQNFDAGMDDVLHNMTVCISNEKNPSDMIESLRKILAKPLVSQDSKALYSDWLEENYELKEPANEVEEPAPQEPQEMVPPKRQIADFIFEESKRRKLI